MSFLKLIYILVSITVVLCEIIQEGYRNEFTLQMRCSERLTINFHKWLESSIGHRWSKHVTRRGGTRATRTRNSSISIFFSLIREADRGWSIRRRNAFLFLSRTSAWKGFTESLKFSSAATRERPIFSGRILPVRSNYFFLLHRDGLIHY